MSDSYQEVHVEALEVPLDPYLNAPRQSVDHHLHGHIARLLRISPSAVLGYDLERRSLDARQKPALRFVYRLTARIVLGAVIHEGPGVQVRTPQPDENDGLHQLPLQHPLPLHPVVVGTGPAGIMAAYLLALHGCKPLILDRGRDVERRGADIERFFTGRELDPDSNYLYGEGGAGTYSDGKLYTRVKDRRMRFLLEAFVEARAPRSILWRHHPHIGSDILPHMARRLRSRIESWGGVFRWDACVEDLVVREGRCVGVRLRGGDICEAPLVIMATGHSARDLIRTLIRRGITASAKGFQLGCRVEHPQELIDRARYGCPAPRPLLSAAEYNLVSRPPAYLRAASVTTFCMCPGGEIIPATSDPGLLSTNGMSRHGRSSPWANAGLIVNQEVDRSGTGLEGLDLLDRLEAAAFAAGGGDYTCPAQAAPAFVRGEQGALPAGGSYRLGRRPARLDQLLPPATAKAIGVALVHYQKTIPGFLSEGVLVGVETRVSSPVRFARDPATGASSLPGLYLAGEGAGFAGGIVSAGLDGLRLAEGILTGRPVRRETRTDPDNPWT